MPPKGKYYNRHADEANQRKTERATNERQAAAKAREDAEWEDTDKKALKKLEKERAIQERAAEQAARKAEKKELLQQEESEMTRGKPKKMTHHDLKMQMSRLLKDYDKEKQKEVAAEHAAEAEPLPQGNVNVGRDVRPAGGPVTVESSGGVGDALASLQKADAAVPDDRHIGKRARVLYRAFCEENLPKLKEDKPHMRRTQYNDLLWEMWQKSMQNPFVQRNEIRAAERLAHERSWMEAEGGGSDDEDAAENDNGNEKK